MLDLARVDSERASELLADLGAVAVSFEECGDDHPIFEPDPGETPLWPDTRVVGLFPDSCEPLLIKFQLAALLGEGVGLSVEPLASKDWERVWMDEFVPMQFGHRLWVCPSHCEVPVPEAINILLDPGLAFGTGTHPTTALCLEWLDASPPTGHTVIDFGCGSGILAIAAARLGAREVWALDIDPQALIATRSNVQHNDVDSVSHILSPEDLPSLQVDLILANILSNPLQELAQRFSVLLKPGGRLVLAGILATQVNEVKRAYQPWFDFHADRSSGDWVRLDAVRLAIESGR